MIAGRLRVLHLHAVGLLGAHQVTKLLSHIFQQQTPTIHSTSFSQYLLLVIMTSRCHLSPQDAPPPSLTGETTAVSSAHHPTPPQMETQDMKKNTTDDIVLSRSSRVFVSQTTAIHETLADRLNRWKVQRTQRKLGIDILGKRPDDDKDRFLNERLRVVALDIAHAMKHFHARGIVVGHLNPSMIGFDADGRAKILIEGGSFVNAPPNGNSKTVGEDLLCYQAPETLSGGMTPQASGDVYSFAMILWEISTLESPYESIVGSRQKVSKDKFESLVVSRKRRPNLSKASIPSGSLRQLIASAWDPNPDARPSFTRVWLNVVKVCEQGSLDNKTVPSSSWSLGIRVAAHLKAFLGKSSSSSEEPGTTSSQRSFSQKSAVSMSSRAGSERSLSQRAVSMSSRTSGEQDDDADSVYSDEEEESEPFSIHSHRPALSASFVLKQKQETKLSTVLFLKA